MHDRMSNASPGFFALRLAAGMESGMAECFGPIAEKAGKVSGQKWQWVGS